MTRDYDLYLAIYLYDDDDDEEEEEEEDIYDR
jgi:hypothetical protein